MVYFTSRHVLGIRRKRFTFPSRSKRQKFVWSISLSG